MVTPNNGINGSENGGDTPPGAISPSPSSHAQLPSPYPIPDKVREALQHSFPFMQDDEFQHLDEKLPLAGGLDRDDAAKILNLVQRKLIETEIEIRKKGVAVGHELISDAPSFAFASAALPGYFLQFNEAAGSFLSHDLSFYAASAAGLVLLHRFVKKELQVLDEFMQVYNIWKPYVETRKAANKIREEALKLSNEEALYEGLRLSISMKDRGMAELLARFRGSGLLFEGIKIPKDYESRLTNGFYFDDTKVDAIAHDVQAKLEARGTILKELAYRGALVAGFVKQAPQTILRQTWDKVKGISADIWDNTRKIHKTFARVCAGPKYVWKPDINYRQYLNDLLAEGPKYENDANYQAARLDLISHLQQAKEDASTYCIASVFGGAHTALLPIECWAFGNEMLHLFSGAAGSGMEGVVPVLSTLGTVLVSYFSLMVFSDPLRQTVDNLEKNLGKDGVLKGKIAHYIEVKEGLGKPKEEKPKDDGNNQGPPPSLPPPAVSSGPVAPESPPQP